MIFDLLLHFLYFAVISSISEYNPVFPRLLYFTFRSHPKVFPSWQHLLQFPASPNHSDLLACQPSPKPPITLAPSQVRWSQLGPPSGLQEFYPVIATPSLCPTSRRVLQLLLCDLTPQNSLIVPHLCFRNLRPWRLPQSTRCTPSRLHWGRDTNTVAKEHCLGASPEVIHWYDCPCIRILFLLR